MRSDILDWWDECTRQEAINAGKAFEEERDRLLEQTRWPRVQFRAHVILALGFFALGSAVTLLISWIGGR